MAGVLLLSPPRNENGSEPPPPRPTVTLPTARTSGWKSAQLTSIYCWSGGALCSGVSPSKLTNYLEGFLGLLGLILRWYRTLKRVTPSQPSCRLIKRYITIVYETASLSNLTIKQFTTVVKNLWRSVSMLHARLWFKSILSNLAS
jgi:hypothetical protein